MGFLVNIDNGGTFTDVCVSDGARLIHAKSPTTPHDLTQCFIDTLRRASAELYGEDDLARLIRETDYLRYSTTSGTNAVVERKGTPVAVLVERGEEDTVYGATRAQAGGDLWHAMVPGRPIGIAVGAGGEVDETELIRVINEMLAGGVQRLVVALRTSAAEESVKDILLERYPRHLLGAIPFLLSWELAHDADHARRTVTAVVNSYLHPGMEHFLYGAENVCKQQHLRRPLLIFRNDGDSARVAKTTALKTWGSGPRGGVEGSIAYARLYGIATLVGMDIGGTTTDVSVVRDGGVDMLASGAVGVLATSFPLPSLQSHGLGGSSVIGVAGGRISIGPESTGAAPGPACFGRGGTEATLTDALLLAGVLDGERYLGGQLQLDAARARAAIARRVGEPLGLSVEAATAAIIAAFEAAVGEVLRRSLAQAGRDPADAVLLAFGGGGPMIACGIAAAAGMKRVLVPHLAAVFSAFGIGFSNLAHVHEVPLEAAGGRLDAARADLEARARRDMYGEGVDPKECAYAFSVRSSSAGLSVTQPLVNGALPAPAGTDARLSLAATYALPTFKLVADTGRAGQAPPATGRAELRLSAGAATPVALYADADLHPGGTLCGPALVRGNYLTAVIPAGWRLRVTDNHDLTFEVA